VGPSVHTVLVVAAAMEVDSATTTVDVSSCVPFAILTAAFINLLTLSMEKCSYMYIICGDVITLLGMVVR
jgi:hypothetical protein